MRSLALFVAIILAILVMPLLFVKPDGGQPAQASGGHPWQIERLPEGRSKVFDIELGRATLADVRQRWGNDLEVALLIAPEETGSVEAYYQSLTAGQVTGKLVLNITTTLEQREQMLARAKKAEFMQGTTRRVTLDEADISALNGFPVAAMTFIPAANLDEEIILQRFGKPTERIRSNENTEHFLYPDLGLDLQLNVKGKEVLQYVAPRDFAALIAPLKSPPKADKPS